MKANTTVAQMPDGSFEVTTTITDPPTVGKGETQKEACTDLINQLRAQGFYHLTVVEADDML